MDNRRGKDYDPGMSTQPRTPTPRMTVEEFLAWAEGRPGRHELVRGEVIAQAAERAAHWEVKLATHVALLAAIKREGASLSRRAGRRDRADRRGDGLRTGRHGLLRPEPAPSAMLVENPVIIVEVLSPSTGRRDQGRKLADYFRLPSVAHYLIIDPDETLVIHHQRRADDEILTRILREATIALDPPGIEVEVAEIYGGGGYSPAST